MGDKDKGQEVVNSGAIIREYVASPTCSQFGDESDLYHIAIGGIQQVAPDHEPDPDLPEHVTENCDEPTPTGYHIYEDELYPVLSLNNVYDDDGNRVGYARGYDELPNWFIERYERHLEEHERIQGMMKQYMKDGDIHYTTLFLSQYLDVNKAREIAISYAGEKNVSNMVEKKKIEIRCDVFESRNRISGSDEDRKNAVMRRLKEWILEEFK